MNYENFSPEAKQAIEHLRKFLLKNKSKIKKKKDICYTMLVDDCYEVVLWSMAHHSVLSFGVSFEESTNVVQFCLDKNYWLDSK